MSNYEQKIKKLVLAIKKLYKEYDEGDSIVLTKSPNVWLLTITYRSMGYVQETHYIDFKEEQVRVISTETGKFTETLKEYYDNADDWKETLSEAGKGEY